MIAYHFPPLRGSSGIQRTLKFAHYLPESGWQPIVLSAHPRAYENTSSDQLGDIAPGTIVSRPFALDTARHLAILRRYPRLLALPDRWISWILGAVPAGLKLMRRHQCDVIWSTYPIATAHLIGLALHKLTGIPWVVDMRDPMTDEDYPAERLVRRIFQWVERKALRNASLVVCTTPGAIADYRARYPEIPAERYRLIENGYDEEHFAAAQARCTEQDHRFTLLHSGIVYPSERDPTALFEALAQLKKQGRIDCSQFRLVLRATAHDAHIGAMLSRHGIDDLVELAPPLGYRDALSEMLSVNALLILQAANCNRQVPAKLYEYLRAGRPILALTDTDGDTATVLRQAGIDTITRLDSKDEIMNALPRFIALARTGQAPRVLQGQIHSYSRKSRARELASALDDAAGRIDEIGYMREYDEKPSR
ncbi:MAG: glycosyltransferase [Bacillota bacterium]